MQDSCKTRGSKRPLPGLWFSRYPLLGALLLLAVTVLLPLVVYAIDEYTPRVFLAWAVAVFTVLLAYVPFLSVLSEAIRPYSACENISAAYLLYLLLALQVAHANVAFAVHVGDEANAYSNVCGEAWTSQCTVSEAPYWVYFRFFYWSSVTFASVGYGDISPQTFLATFTTLPHLWSPIFYLGVLLGKILYTSG